MLTNSVDNSKIALQERVQVLTESQPGWDAFSAAIKEDASRRQLTIKPSKETPDEFFVMAPNGHLVVQFDHTGPKIRCGIYSKYSDSIEDAYSEAYMDFRVANGHVCLSYDYVDMTFVEAASCLLDMLTPIETETDF